MRTAYTNAIILTMETDFSPFLGTLVIENNMILGVYEGESFPMDMAVDHTVDMSNKVILPGFINTHGHTAMSLLRGYADDLPLQEWLEEKMWPLEAKYKREQVTAGTALSIAEMIRSGTTCFLDMYDHMDAVAELVEKTGIRASLCRGCIGFGDDALRKNKLIEATNFAKNWNGAAEGRISTMMSPHSPYTCTPDYIARFIEKALEIGVPIHTHMSETAREVAQNVEEYGKRPVEHLDSLGFFDLPSLVAHAVHLTEGEIDLLASKNVKVSHNPGSNLKLGSGIAPITKMIDAGIRPSLGTDSSASNNNLDLLEEIQLAALIHKGVNQNPLAVPAKTALLMGTAYGAEALFLDEITGTLSKGKKADFITIDITGTHMQPAHDIVSHIVYASSRSDIVDVFVDGKALMRNRELTTIDEEKVSAEANQSFFDLIR
ncbi:amidohydrolase [Shimazuella sp. AN120528]|uniref:amidohydrolase n=1 Tax=Shimazuella soli TaxID=1892854 RepID=UPI001F0E9765|nr:amidohydrolase [Shimazuella soli]MCH5585508.1 amidohydrolase [Shimazuella soli]